MKLHLPKLLRVALIAALSCPMAPAASAATTYPDVKEVTEGENTYTYINVGKATASNSLNGFAFNSDLVVEEGDLVGYFDDAAWESDSATTVKV